ncbi:MAG: hypothetical protein LBC62_09355 [Treponema sp.]|jgi:alpha-L-rhamnosidase|nr:hypothetical protein [Treponema sp.]
MTGHAAIAIEVASYKVPDQYSNNITLEQGVLLAEVWAGGVLLAATGCETPVQWRSRELFYRASQVELLSHCREIIEVYNLAPEDGAWRTAAAGDWCIPVVVEESVRLLPRRAPMPELCPIVFQKLVRAADISEGTPCGNRGRVNYAPLWRKIWYDAIDSQVVPDVSRDTEAGFTGELIPLEGGWFVRPGKTKQAAIVWDLKQVAVGFFQVRIELEQDTVIDLQHSDVLSADGSLYEPATVVRYNLKKGKHLLTSFEPYLVRYLKLVARCEGAIKITRIELLTYWYPDREIGSFTCSDPETNRIYEAARRTLQCNTLDIFMDCPERERGGWLCDSFWTARAAWMMLGDLDVEKDFLENFFLQQADRYEPYGFFPEVYPGNSRYGKKSIGITTWSFWLMLELCEYYERSGDALFIQQIFPRVEQFVKGANDFIGKSGLLENLTGVFIDWSQSNYAENTAPISVPANALYAFTLCELGRVYHREDWSKQGEAIRGILRQALTPPQDFFFRALPDALVYNEGKFTSKQCSSESAHFIDVWAGLFGTDTALTEKVIQKMGSHPSEARDLTIGLADLFIGLIIRHDMLAKEGAYDVLLSELRKLYLAQLQKGSGTFFEHLGMSDSNCHGMNGHAGVLLMRDILGLGEPRRLNKTIRIAPHPSDLEWASGTVRCDNRNAVLTWRVDRKGQNFYLDITLPSGWTADIDLPKEFKGWNIFMSENRS